MKRIGEIGRFFASRNFSYMLFFILLVLSGCVSPPLNVGGNYWESDFQIYECNDEIRERYNVSNEVKFNVDDIGNCCWLNNIVYNESQDLWERHKICFALKKEN